MLRQLSIKNTLARLIHKCKEIKHLNQIHSNIITSQILSPISRSFLISRLLLSHCTEPSNSPASLQYAVEIFNLISRPSLFIYNAMIRANATRLNDPFSRECLVLYNKLLWSGLIPDSITFPFVLKECAKRADGTVGRSIHAHVLMFGYGKDVYVRNSLIALYSECGVLKNARKVFDEMFNNDVVSWNSIIVGCLRGGELDLAVDLFIKMEKRKNIFTWNSIITGLVQGGRAKEALQFFQEMQISEDNTICPNKITIASVISACASLGTIDYGRWVHGYIERSGIQSDMVIETALVDMYGKCGCVGKAFEIFKNMHNKDVHAYTAMISVLALHGCGNEAFDILSEMEEYKVRPNSVTFTSLLSACAHSGLVKKGRMCFEMMKCVHGIEPRAQHYACMVDILGRAGLFIEAEDLIRRMPMRPDVYVWGALLGGCQMHGNVKLGERVAKYLIALEPENHTFYMNLCDIYGKAGRFDDVKKLRCLMKDLEIKKEVPGSSLIEIDGAVYEFCVRGSGEILSKALSDILMVLNNEAKVEASEIYSLHHEIIAR